MSCTRMGTAMLVALMGTACGGGGSATGGAQASASSRSLTLPCAESEQTVVLWDVSGPGRPTAREAVAPYAGALTLVVQGSAGGTTVFGLRDDGTVLRAYQVTKADDGWWPDGYRECSG